MQLRDLDWLIFFEVPFSSLLLSLMGQSNSDNILSNEGIYTLCVRYYLRAVVSQSQISLMLSCWCAWRLRSYHPLACSLVGQRDAQGHSIYITGIYHSTLTHPCENFASVSCLHQNCRFYPQSLSLTASDFGVDWV